MRQNVEGFVFLCRCCCKNKLVELVILFCRINCFLSPLRFKNLVLRTDPQMFFQSHRFHVLVNPGECGTSSKLVARLEPAKLITKITNKYNYLAEEKKALSAEKLILSFPVGVASIKPFHFLQQVPWLHMPSLFALNYLTSHQLFINSIIPKCDSSCVLGMLSSISLSACHWNLLNPTQGTPSCAIFSWLCGKTEEIFVVKHENDADCRWFHHCLVHKTL